MTEKAELGVINIHPDYIQTCIALCCTGSSRECRFTPGTICLVRKTAGGQGKKEYGVVGLWYFTGRCEPTARRDRMWPARWGQKVLFEPLVRQFSATWCEEFSVRPAGAHHNQSVHVPGLTYIMLQGSIVRVRDKVIAAAYLESLMKARPEELSRMTSYMGRQTKVVELLMTLQEKLREN